MSLLPGGAPWCTVLTLSVLVLLVHGDDLCARCETTDMKQLRQYYDDLQVTSVSFRQFVYNLLETMDERPRLAPVRQELLTIVHRFDDCVRTCEIPFTKRRSPSDVTDTLLLGAPGGKPWNKAGSYHDAEKKNIKRSPGVWTDGQEAGKSAGRWSKDLLDDLTLTPDKRW